MEEKARIKAHAETDEKFKTILDSIPQDDPMWYYAALGISSMWRNEKECIDILARAAKKNDN